jgi:anti-anti-sigma regulatory factor
MAVHATPSSTPLAIGHDRCPYARPFPADFVECPAYQQMTFTAADSSNRVLGDHLTCRHLGVGRNRSEQGGFYGRCSLGGRADRLRWVAEMRPERLEAIQAISADLEELNSARRQVLFAAKSSVLAAPADMARRQELRAVIDDYMNALRAFVATHDEPLSAVGLPGPQLLELIEEWMMRWAKTRDMAAVAPDQGLLAAFDGPVQMLFGARIGDGEQDDADASGEPGQGKHEPLQVEVSKDSRALTITGEIDAATTDALGAALAAALATGTRSVDLSGVISCDAGGLRALVTAAAGLPEGEHLLVTGMPPHLHKVLRQAGWGESPKLRVQPMAAS